METFEKVSDSVFDRIDDTIEEMKKAGLKPELISDKRLCSGRGRLWKIKTININGDFDHADIFLQYIPYVYNIEADVYGHDLGAVALVTFEFRRN